MSDGLMVHMVFPGAGSDQIRRTRIGVGVLEEISYRQGTNE